MALTGFDFEGFTFFVEAFLTLTGFAFLEGFTALEGFDFLVGLPPLATFLDVFLVDFTDLDFFIILRN
ncbi:MAG: hypothetical protein ABI855_00235 [Bacteroidota bacterium]